MNAEQQVIDAARTRAAALAEGDADRLRSLLHVDFRWTSHTGQSFTREEYIDANAGGATVWRRQTLLDPQVTIVDNVAVLRCEVLDEVEGGPGWESFRMPMTQVWVHAETGWMCLAGHAGPRLPE